MLLSHLFPTVVFMTFGLLLTGCNQNTGRNLKIVEVSGVVTLDGSPLQDGVVDMMDRVTGFSAGAPLDAEGRFKIEKIPTGSYEVVVRPPYPPGPGETPPPRPSTMGPVRPVPKKYLTSDTSGFRLEVPKEGVVDVKYELVSEESRTKTALSNETR